MRTCDNLSLNMALNFMDEYQIDSRYQDVASICMTTVMLITLIFGAFCFWEFVVCGVTDDEEEIICRNKDDPTYIHVRHHPIYHGACAKKPTMTRA